MYVRYVLKHLLIYLQLKKLSMLQKFDVSQYSDTVALELNLAPQYPEKLKHVSTHE